MSTTNMLTLSDYIVIGAMLLFSTVVAIYHGFNPTRQDSKKETSEDDDKIGGEGVLEYFLANRNMSMFPVAVSFFATACSSLSITGPAMEVYGFGLSICWLAIINIPISMLVAKLFVPIFYNMKSINIYNFTELRYNRKMKEIIVVLYTIRSAMFGSTVVYGTSVAFSKVTEINTWLVICTVTGVCLFYTILGGIRGVMWVDAFQGVLMLGSMIVLILIGTYHVGGVSKIWNNIYDTGRVSLLEFDFNLTTRHTFWSDALGLFVSNFCYFTTSQAIMHRLLTAPSVAIAQRSSYLGFLIQSTMVFLSVGIGCIMFTAFYDCDPLTSKSVQNMNELVPKFVANILGPYPILPGLFFTGLLSACLSTLSSAFNSIAAILLETFMQQRFPKFTSAHGTNICRFLGTGIFTGFLTMLCVLITELFPNAMQAAFSSCSAFDGPLMGILFIGIFAPQAKFKVVLMAFIGGVFTTLWIVAGGLIVNEPLKMKPLFTDGCDLNETTSLINGLDYTYANISRFAYSTLENSTAILKSPEIRWEKYFPFHNVTFQFIALVGLSTYCVLFTILSVVFGGENKNRLNFNPLDFIPKKVQQFQRQLPKIVRIFLLCDIYDDASGALEKGNGLQMTTERPVANTILTDVAPINESAKDQCECFSQHI